MEHTTHKVIRPRLQTPSAGPRETTGFGRLPDDLLSEQVRRLAMCAAVGAALWSYGLVMDFFVAPLTVARVAPAATVVIEIIAIVISIAMFLYVRYASHASHIKTDAGLAYVVLNAVGVASVADLAVRLRADPTRGQGLNEALVGAGCSAFHAETLGILASLLLD